MTQKEAVKILDSSIENSSDKYKRLPNESKVIFVSNEIYTALNSCFDWRKEQGLKFKGEKIFYKDIEIKMTASARLKRKKLAKKSNFGTSVRSSSQNKKRRNKKRMIKQSRKNNRR